MHLGLEIRCDNLRILLRVAFSVGYLAACRTHDAGVANDRAPTSTVGARQALLAELRHATPSGQAVPEDSTINVVVDSSRAVPGLIYYRGTYLPPNTMHVVHGAVVVLRDTAVRVLRTIDDWSAIAHGWQPQSAAEALNACVELATQVSPRAYRVEPKLFRDQSSIKDPRIVPGERGPNRARSPDIDSLGGHRWAAQFWLIEVGALRKYRCTLGSGGAAPSITVVDSMPGAGFLP